MNHMMAGWNARRMDTRAYTLWTACDCPDGSETRQRGRVSIEIVADTKKYGTTPDGRIFRTARGGIIQDSAYSAVWAQARKAALADAQCRSPLGRRP